MWQRDWRRLGSVNGRGWIDRGRSWGGGAQSQLAHCSRHFPIAFSHFPHCKGVWWENAQRVGIERNPPHHWTLGGAPGFCDFCLLPRINCEVKIFQAASRIRDYQPNVRSLAVESDCDIADRRGGLGGSNGLETASGRRRALAKSQRLVFPCENAFLESSHGSTIPTRSGLGCIMKLLFRVKEGLLSIRIVSEPEMACNNHIHGCFKSRRHLWHWPSGTHSAHVQIATSHNLIHPP